MASVKSNRFLSSTLFQTIKINLEDDIVNFSGLIKSRFSEKSDDASISVLVMDYSSGSIITLILIIYSLGTRCMFSGGNYIILINGMSVKFE